MKIIKIMLFCLLFVSGQILAERPAMDDRPAASERPAATTATPEPESSDRPAMEARPLDDELEEQLDAPRAVTAEPPRAQTVTTTGTVLELQPGETVPVHMLDFPRRGMTMDKVQNELGQPAAISPTVGDPPITAWTYPDRVVYFEYSKVIHAVAAN